MIVRSDELADDAELQCDLCIVGAGPAGISLANELHGSGLSIILLEAGRAAFRSEGTGRAFWARSRWGTPIVLPICIGGACSAAHPRREAVCAIVGSHQDLERRDYVPQSGWPIGWPELERYYRRAQVYFDAGAFDYRVPTSLGPAATDSSLRNRSIPTF